MIKKEFTSISSDNNLFDLEHIVRVSMKAANISKEEQYARVEAYLRKKHPNASPGVFPTLTAMFISSDMAFKHFCEMMDALNCDLMISVRLPLRANLHPPIWDKSINELDMPVRVTNILRDRESIYSIGQLISHSSNSLMKIPGFGHSALAYVTEAVTKAGLALGTKTNGWTPPKEE
jgi:DNA-directed RNA polymerase alpha subunit